MRILLVTTSAATAMFVIGVTGGCYNTARSKQSATSLTTRMAEYRDHQDTRVKKLNDEFSDAFARLMDTLEDLSQAELQQARDGDAQAISDQMIADNNASLRSRFREAFAQTVRDQRKHIGDADLAVAAVRDSYLKSYVEAKLEIAKINTVIKNLESMSHDPTDAQKVQEAINVIQTFVKAYDEAKKKTGKPAAPSSTPATP